MNMTKRERAALTVENLQYDLDSAIRSLGWAVVRAVCEGKALGALDTRAIISMAASAHQAWISLCEVDVGDHRHGYAEARKLLDC